MNFGEVTLELLSGFGTTCLLFLVTLLVALPVGLLVAFASMSKFKPLKYVTRVFIWIIRGTPLMLQIIIIYYVPGMLGLVFSFPTRDMDTIFWASVAFVINYSCYFAVIYRGGIESISKGQYEAGQVLGMTKSQIFFKIVLLQVVKRIMAPMSNEVITLVKDTSLAQIIVAPELMNNVNEIISKLHIIYPMFYAGVFYLLFVGVLTLLFGFIEKKLNYFRV